MIPPRIELLSPGSLAITLNDTSMLSELFQIEQ